jgi:CBS domain containing-hemolysin-like protein
MTNIVLACVFLILALVGVVVRKTYFRIPARELKRRAEKGDKHARQLYRAVAYGSSLQALLWLYIGVTSAASIVLFAQNLSLLVSLLIVGPLLWATFSLLPSTRITKYGRGITEFVTPMLAWLLNYLHPLLSRSSEVVRRRYVVSDHTRLYEKDDLLDLIERQHWQDDSRLTDEEIEIIKRAIRFPERHVYEALTPSKAVKTVLADETLGPVLISELHDSGQDFVLVQAEKEGDFVGALNIRRLGIHTSGKVKDFMHQNIYYLHEDDSLSDALHAFFVTNHPVFVVVNSHQEHVGIITIENVLKKLLGHMPGDDFDQYSDPAAVAARHANKHLDSGELPQEDSETPVKTEEEVLE